MYDSRMERYGYVATDSADIVKYGISRPAMPTQSKPYQFSDNSLFILKAPRCGAFNMNKEELRPITLKKGTKGFFHKFFTKTFDDEPGSKKQYALYETEDGTVKKYRRSMSSSPTETNTTVKA